jgi:hypothetical protein
MNKDRLARVEEYVLGLFRRAGATRLLVREVFGDSTGYANADIVRAFEDLEKRLRALVRHTEEGDDWVTLTPEGARLAGLPAPEDPPPAFPHPPKSSTKP